MKFIHTESDIIEITTNVIDLSLGDVFYKEFTADGSFTFINVPTSKTKTIYICSKNTSKNSYRAEFITPASAIYAYAACPEWATKITLTTDASSVVTMAFSDIKVFDWGVNIYSNNISTSTRTSVDANGYLSGTHQMEISSVGVGMVAKDGSEPLFRDHNFIGKFNGPVSTIKRSINNSGKFIYIGGSFTKFEDTSIKYFARFYADTLTLDRSFNILSNGPTSGAVLDIEGSTDSAIIVGSFTGFNKYNLYKSNRNILTFNSSGAIQKIGSADYLCSKFTGGIVQAIEISGNYAYISGTFISFNGSSCPALIKVNLLTSELDNTFSSNITSENTSINYVYDMKIINAGTANEAIYLFGVFSKINGITKSPGIVKISKGGICDVNFNAVVSSLGTYWPNIAIDSNNDIFVSDVITSNSVNGLFSIVKINGLTGANDNTFQIKSVNFKDAQKVYYNPYDGYIYACGSFNSYYGTPGGINSAYVVKINATTGEPDLTFAVKFNDSVSSLEFSGSYMYASGIFTTCAIGSGSAVSLTGLAKINLATSTIDATFNPGTGLTATSAAYSFLKLASNGDLLVYLKSSTTLTYQGSSYYVARINPSTGAVLSGSISSSKINTGSITYVVSEYSNTLMIGNNGGYNDTYSYYVEVDSTGEVTSSFNPGTGFNATVRAICGRIFGGDFTSYNGNAVNYLCQLSTNGTLYNYNASNTVRVIRRLINDYSIDASGTYGYLVGGDFVTILGTTCNRIAALNIASSISLHPISNKFGTGFNGSVYDIQVWSSNTGANTFSIVCGGSFTTYNGASVPANIAFLTQSLGGTFTNSSSSTYFGTGAFGSVYSIALDNASIPSGIWIGGAFSSFNSVSTNQHIYYASLSGTATSDSVSKLINRTTSASSSNVLSLFAGISNPFKGSGVLDYKYCLVGFSSASVPLTNNIYRLNLAKNRPTDLSVNSQTFVKPGNAFTCAFNDGNYIYLGGSSAASIGAENNWPTQVTIKGLARISAATGELDTAFNTAMGTGSTNSILNIIRVGNSIYATGLFNSFNSIQAKGIVKIDINYNTNAPTISSTFNVGTGTYSSLGASTVNTYGAIAYSSTNGYIYLSASYGNFLYRINPITGVYDTSFLGATSNNTIYDIIINNNYIYMSIGGAYLYNNVTQTSSGTQIVKLNLDGTFVATYAVNGTAYRICVDGNNLYAVTSNAYTYKFDISGANLTVDTSFISPVNNTVPFLYNCFVYGDNLYIMGSLSSGIMLKNLSFRSNVFIVNKYTGQSKCGLPDYTNF
jgi:hypothetical protein